VFSDEPSIYSYFENYARWMDALEPDDEYASILLASLEMLRSGITFFMDAGSVFDTDAGAAAAERIGIRASLAECYLWDVTESPRFHPLDRAPGDLDRSLKLLGSELHRNDDPASLVRGHVAIFGAGTGSDELLVAAATVAKENGAIFTQQQSYENDDIAFDDQRYGRSPMVHLEELGILGPHCTFAVMNAIRPEEVDPIVASGISLAWNPANAMYYSARLSYTDQSAKLHRAGVPIGLATDVAKAWGYGEQGYIGYLLTRLRGDYLAPEDILEMATLGGAKAVGIPDRVGSLEEGKRADVVVRAPGITEARPETNVVRNLVLTERTRSVRTVVVDGRVVLEDGEAVLVATEEIHRLAAESARRMVRRSGIEPRTRWPLLNARATET
jgi:5-methylthioadenosine/S-adenosylhomocysteine deaminase